MKNIERCNQCGICNLNCPAHIVTQKETASPRFKVFLLKKGEYNKSFYLCSCDLCLEKCPANVKIDNQELRAEMVKKGMETAPNKIMRENMKKYGQPFGRIKKGQKPPTLYT